MNNIIGVINIVVLFLTFIVIIWYSWETRQLRKVTQKQLELNILPILSVEQITDKLIIKNIGKSPALNVAIDSIKDRPYPDLSEKGKYGFSFGDPIPSINVEEKKLLEIKVIPPSTGHQNPNIATFLNPANQYFSGEYEMKINYEDINHKAIYSIFKINKKGINFQEIKYNT